jgi:hypothetical protein
MTGNLFHELSKSVNIDGLEELSSAGSRWERGFWSLILLSNVLLAGFYSYRVIGEFVDNNTATKVSLSQSLLNSIESSYVFFALSGLSSASREYSYPPLTLCLSIWMNLSHAREMGLSEDAVKASLKYLNTKHALVNDTAAEEELAAFIEKHAYGSLLGFFKAMILDVKGRIDCS